MGYKFLEHTADMKILVNEKTLEDAFKTSALAMKEAIVGKIKIKPLTAKNILVEGKDYERLLYEFLEQFIYLLDAENYIISSVKSLKVEEEIGCFRLSATVLGDKASSYKFTNNVKAITYNEMLVSENNKGEMVIQFVIDV